MRWLVATASLLVSLGNGEIVAQSVSAEVERGPRGRSEIALTFDAGGEVDCFEDLIAALSRTHVHSTFFITGKWAYENPECARAITKRGHEIGNHTWNHLDLTRCSDATVRQELQSAELFLTNICGHNPRVAQSLGYRSIYWTLDSLDSIEPPKSVPFLIERITNRPNEQLDGAIILMHVGERSTAEALPIIIANLQGRGFQLVTVTTLLGGRVR